MKKIFLITGVVDAMIISTAYGYAQKAKDPWVVPDADKKKVNPIKADASSISDGKALWVKYCQSCHGKTGKGDGTKAAQLETKPGDFSTAATQSQTDGSLFYKIAKGRGDMPGYKKKIPENDDIWSVVNFIRTLKK